MIEFNPFSEYSITDFDQYKRIPFLELQGVKLIKNIIKNRIRDNFVFPERLLLLGQRGIGKTSTLFFIKNILDKNNTQNFTFSRLIESSDQFKISTGKFISDVSNEPVFFLFDFPDNVELRNFKNFLNFVWSLITHKNNKNINLIFSLNISHYDASLSFSETLGKFHRVMLDNLNNNETKEIINSRLKLSGDIEFFDEETKDLVYTYSKGIPRNIICASKDLTDSYINKNKITKKMADLLLKEEYVGKIINDRVEDYLERQNFLKIISIIKNNFNGKVESQELLVNFARKECVIGRNKVLFYIDELYKFGLISIIKGGEKRNKKVIILK